MRYRHLAVVALIALSSCGKKEEAPAPTAKTPPSIPEKFDAYVAKNERKWALEEEFDAAVQAADQKEMVRPAPADFRPEPGRKLRLVLIPKSTVLKKGEAFWYRAELQNLGDETISFRQGASFWKEGNEITDKYKFRIRRPDGEERAELFRVFYEFHTIGGGAREQMNAAQRKEHAFRVARRRGLRVDLRPGETLVSRPWRLPTTQELRDRFYRDIEPAPVAGEFRELALMPGRALKQPGKYQLRLIFQDYTPKAPTERDIQKRVDRGETRDEAERRENRYYQRALERSLGRVESNTIEIEVRR